MSPAKESDTVLSTVSYFLRVLPLHNPHWIKSSRYFPVCSIHPTWCSYIPYLRWIAFAAGSIVPVDIEKEAQAPLVIWCPVCSCYLQGTLVSICLLSIMRVFLSVAGIWLQDFSRDNMTIVTLLHFSFFSSYLSFCKQENVQVFQKFWTHKQQKSQQLQ